jgi:hypothetical protein
MKPSLVSGEAPVVDHAGGRRRHIILLGIEFFRASPCRMERFPYLLLSRDADGALAGGDRPLRRGHEP